MTSRDLVDNDTLRDPDRVQPHDAPAATSDYFVFRLRGRTYALAPSAVERVVPMQPLVTIPTASAHVRGVMYLRGRVIAVVDLAALLAIDDQPAAQDSARIVIATGPSPFAFVVDATLGIWAFSDAALTRDNDDGPIISGRLEDRGGAATLIDVRAAFDRLVGLRVERS